MGNQIDAARTRFVNVHCWSCNADFHHEKTRNSGRGGIRTHGGSPHARFRVECLKPDSATLPFCNSPALRKEPLNISCGLAFATDEAKGSGFRVQGCGDKFERLKPESGALNFWIKKCYNFGLAKPFWVTAYCISTGQPRYYLLLTGIHRVFAPYSNPQPSLTANDSTKTWNSARLAGTIA